MAGWWTACAVSLVVWLVALVVLMLASRVRVRPVGGVPDDGLPVDPALAALLYPPNGKVPERAATGLLWDLVAREYLTVWTDRDGHLWVRVADEVPEAPLAPYERRVFDHVQARADSGSGVVPAAALGVRDGDSSGHSLRAEFASEVEQAARRRGLVASRVPLPVRLVVHAIALSSVLCAVAALVTVHAGGFGIFLVPVLIVLVSLGESRLGRPVPRRPEGLAMAARCAAFPPRTPVLVPAAGNRLAGYAIARGNADPGQLSLQAARRKDMLWSNRGREWRQVRIRANHVPSAGDEPGPIGLVAIGLSSALFLGVWLILLVFFSVVVSAHAAWIWPVLVESAAWVVWGLLAFAIGRHLYSSAVNLIRPPRIVTGEVVHMEDLPDGESTTCLVAIDDGSADELVRYQIPAGLYASIRYGSVIRLELTARGGRVRNAELVRTPDPEHPA